MLHHVIALALPLLAAPTADDAVCPISGKPARADVLLYEKVYFCCMDCRGKYIEQKGLSADAGTCPISEKPASLEFHLAVGDKLLYFCCADCRKKCAEASGVAVDQKLGAVGKCPVSGEDGNEAAFAIQKVTFCCVDCRASYAKKRGIAITATVAPPEDVCPVSGRPINPEQWIVSEGKRVAFCCGDCEKTWIKKNDNKLSEAQKAQAWELLFNGESLEGFQEPTRDGKWEARDGLIVGSQGKGVLATQKTYDNFELVTDARISDTGESRGNSGIYIRSTGLMEHRGRWPDGFEIQIDHGDPEFSTGGIFRAAQPEKTDVKDGQWFTMKIIASGPRIRVWVNGKQVSDHVHEGPIVKGPISLQVHHETDVVEFKNLKVRPLRSS